MTICNYSFITNLINLLIIIIRQKQLNLPQHNNLARNSPGLGRRVLDLSSFYERPSFPLALAFSSRGGENRMTRGDKRADERGH